MTLGSIAPIGQSSSSKEVRTGSWQPLPYIYSGLVIHPFHPISEPPTASSIPEKQSISSHQHRFSWSGLPTIPGEDGAGGIAPASAAATGHTSSAKGNVHEVPLDVGDEFFAFEEYRCTPEEDGLGSTWYRGYIVQAVSLPRLMPRGPTDNSQYPHVEPSVLIGIFPASVVAIRPNIVMENDVSTSAFQKAQSMAADRFKELAEPKREMDAVKEEDEDDIEGYIVGANDIVPVRSPRTKSKSLDRSDSTSGLKRMNRPKSLLLDFPPSTTDKENPPLPQLTAGDSTVAGQQWPLVDEIACAIREWYARLPTYLANREYRLFNAVVQHIDALFLGRRQLLSQMLSGDELVRVRRECVSRLVKCNVAQGLEVIVRNLEDGSIVVVDKEKAMAGSSWIGGIPCYVFQVQLAYIDLVPLDTLLGTRRVPRPLSVLKTGLGSMVPPHVTLGHHLLLDFRAFVASPCSSGETAELYFSLYNKIESKFLTEEFCLVLNHLGSPARDAELRLGRLRTLFTDLKVEEITNTFLVCRLVRNGAMRMSLEASSSGEGLTRRPSNVGDSVGGGQWRSSVSVAEMTDDSFSVTSGFGGHRTDTVETTGSVSGRPNFRRPFGCAVIELPQLARLTTDGMADDLFMPIFVAVDEAKFSSLHEDIIHKREGKYEKSPRAEGIAIGLKFFNGSIEQVTRQHPSLLLDVPLTARLGFPDVVFPGIVRNDVYVKLWSGSFALSSMPTGSLRVRKSVTPTLGNFQVTVEVRRADGNIVPDVLYAGGSGEAPMSQYQSLVYYNNERPTFGELIKVSLPPDASDTHLFLTFRSRDRSPSAELEKPFAFGYLPLFTSTSCIKDGSHDLILYRMERNLIPGPNLYFGVPATGSNPSSTPNVTALRDRITLRTFLCSTVHSQDETIRSLLDWQRSTDTLPQTLQMFVFVPEDEIAKFLRPILDALFGIIVSANQDPRIEIDDLAFQGLVKVFSMASDRRYPAFKSVLSKYLTSNFNQGASAFHLLRTMKRMMGRPESKEYRSLLKVWHLIFRFIIRARELDRSRGTGLVSDHMDAEFKRQTREILDEINSLMLSTNKALIGSQTLAVQHYSDILPDLAQVFVPSELAEMVITFADTLSQASGSLAIYKLLLLLQVVKSVFETTDTRAMLIPAIVRWVKPHLGKYEDYSSKNESQEAKDAKKLKWLECNRLAVTVVAWTVNKLQEWHDTPAIAEDPALEAQEADNIEYCLSMLPLLLSSYKELASDSTAATLNRHRSSPTVWKSTPDVFPMTHPFSLIADLPPPPLAEQQDDQNRPVGVFECGLAEIAVVVFTLVLATPAPNMLRWLLETLDLGGTQALGSILKQIFDFSSSIIRFEAFPRQWLTLNLMCFGGIIKLLEPVSQVMQREAFIPQIKDVEAFDVELWEKCFKLLCDFCASDELALEEQSLQRRRTAWIVAGDVRDQGAVILKDLWNAIGWPMTRGGSRYGGYQTRFTSLAERVLVLCLSTHDRLCEIAVEILFSMIYAEYMLDGKFTSIENEIFSKLDALFTRSTPTSESAMRAYFISQLRSVFESSPEIDSVFARGVAAFLDEVELFIDLLMAVRDLPETTEWKDERSSATYRLMDFFKRIGRSDLYIKFVHQLVAINVEAKDWLGAGLALKLHADLYEWSLSTELLDDFKGSIVQFPPQTQFERKEALYYHALDYLAEAEAYEFAIDLCQTLVQAHQRLTFNISRISELLSHQARLWQRVGASSRPKPEYFRVAYFGPFSTLNKGKEFVVRGAPWQRYSDFCENIQAKYPNALIHRSKIPPPEHLRNQSNNTEECIWITSVIPVPDLNRPMFRENVPLGVQNYYKNNVVGVFESSRPYIVDPNERETVLQWIEKTTLKTAEVLPHLLSRSEVVRISHEHISPLDAAIEQIHQADLNLQKLMAAIPIDIKLLGTALNGAVDSRVNGGIPVYRKTFLSPSYVQRRPMDAGSVEQLRSTILNYVQTIRQALVVHSRYSKDIAFHEALRTLFAKAFPEEIAALPPLVESTIIPPAPINSESVHSSVQQPTENGGIHRSIPSTVPSAGANTSTTATFSSSGHVLPPLRLGPGHKPTASVTSGTNHVMSPVSPMTSPVPAGSPSMGSVGAGSGSPNMRHLDASGSNGSGGALPKANMSSTNVAGGVGGIGGGSIGQGMPSSVPVIGAGSGTAGILLKRTTSGSAKSDGTAPGTGEGDGNSVKSRRESSSLRRFGSLLKR